MDPTAVQMAWNRFRKAQRSLQTFKDAANFEEAEDAWTDFLIATSTIFSKLQEGAAGHPLSEPWWGTKKKQRKDSSVLNYLKFARNSDEHGIVRVTSREPDNWWNGRPVPFGRRMSVTWQKVDKVTLADLGGPTPAYVYGPGIQLIRAHDKRYGDYCDPPERKIPEMDGHYPGDVGDEALRLIRSIIEEAERLV